MQQNVFDTLALKPEDIFQRRNIAVLSVKLPECYFLYYFLEDI